MRTRGISALAAATMLGGALVLLPAPTAQAATAVALWHMSSPASMYDSSGHGHTGATTAITSAAGASGRGYAFNGSSSFVRVPHAADLNPDDGDVRLTAFVKLSAVPDTATADVVRKGLATTTGGMYKMEIGPSNDGTEARAACGFKGSVDEGKVINFTDLADGEFHRISCVKTASRISAVVDGDPASETVQIGRIANKAALTVGGKGPSEDLIEGVLDEISVTIGSRSTQ